MKHVLASALFAGLLTLGACAHSGDMAVSAPSALSVAEIKAELAAISAETSSLWRGRPYPTTPLADQRPTILYVSDSNGVLLTNFSPEPRPFRSSFQGSSRPWGYPRLEVLAKRRAQLYAELDQRAASR